MRGTSFLVFLVCVLSFYGACNAGFVETVYTASLSINQAVPSPNDPQPNAGTAICVYNRNTEPKTLDCEVQQSVTTITGASIQLGERGVSGPFAYNFTVTLGTSFRQIFELQELENYSLDQQIQDFLNGRWYISIFSEDYPLGILRGQLEHADRFYSRLNVQNTIPRATGTSARGIAVGTYSAGNPNRQLALDLVHSVRNPATNGLQIRFGAPGVVGPLIYAFKQPTSPVYAQFDYSINEENEFYAGLQYLNLASATNPSGEIRGQLVTIDYIYELAFTSRLSGNNEETDSTSRGSALVSYDCVTRTMEYLVMHNVPNARGAFAGSGSEDQGASILFQLDNYISPIYGSVVLSPEEEIILYSRIMYFSVTSDNFPEGEIRGQITVDHDFWAYLSGTNVVSPVTTSAVGSATFTLTGQDNRFLNYAIFHSVAEPLEAYVMVGYEGENGVIDRTLRSVFSPIRGEDIQLDDDELEALVTDAMYISITSAEYPVTGEIRGQIKRVNPCRASHDNTLTIGSNNSPNQTDSGVITGTVPLSSNDAVETVAISFALIFGFVLAVLF